MVAPRVAAREFARARLSLRTCAAGLRGENLTSTRDGIGGENGGRSGVVDELGVVDQGENLEEVTG